jgi:hypothetical protein
MKGRRPKTDELTGDVRTLLGLRSVGAWVFVASCASTFALIVATVDTGVTTRWPPYLAVLVATAAAVLIVATPGDPMPLPSTVAVLAAGPVSCALVLPVLAVPVPAPLQTWPIGAATGLYTFLCVRGRTRLAWVGMAATSVTVVVWSAATGQGVVSGAAMMAISLAPLAMSTVFALTIRPAAHSIYALRRRGAADVAHRSAVAAALDERGRQLDRLDELARPMLRRIADGELLNQRDRAACALMEAHLRDSLRAPRLAGSPVADAARAARTRGVDVVLLDDGGNGVGDGAVSELCDLLAPHLDRVRDGAITIRILPPDRDVAATLLITNQSGIERIEFRRNELRNLADLQPQNHSSR